MLAGALVNRQLSICRMNDLKLSLRPPSFAGSSHRQQDIVVHPCGFRFLDKKYCLGKVSTGMKIKSSKSGQSGRLRKKGLAPPNRRLGGAVLLEMGNGKLAARGDWIVMSVDSECV